MSKFNGLGKTHRERILNVNLKLKLRSLFHYEQIVWKIKWMKVPSISSTVTKHLTFNFLSTFCERLKLIADGFKAACHVMTLLLTQIHSEINIFLSTKVIWERAKRVFISYLSAWGSDQRLGFKILPSRKNEIYLWKMAPNVGMYSATHESVTVGRDRKILTG